MPGRPRLTATEIVLGIGAGALAAGAAAAILFGTSGDQAPMLTAAARTESYQVPPFEEISTVGPQDVVVTMGDTQSVRAQGPRDALAQLEAVVENGRLTIRPRRGFDFNWGRLASATYYVTVPRLSAVTLAGGGDIRVDRVTGDRFEGTIGGPGELRLDSVEVGEADFTVAGSGDISAAGAARETRVTVAGSGKIHAAGLHSDDASVSIGGSGDVALTVERDARISITGTGDVDIGGPAHCSITRMGVGDVRCGGKPQ